MRRTRTAVGIGWVLLCLCAAASGDEADDVVKMLVGIAKDDVDLSGKLLSAAAEATDDAKLRGRLYEEAYKAGLKCRSAKGPIASIRSARALIKQRPGERALWEDRLGAAYVRRQQVSAPGEVHQAGAELVDVMIELADERLSAGRCEDALRFLRDASRVATAVKYRSDEVRFRLAEAVARRRCEVRAAELKEKLTAGEAQARSELVRLYVAELDRPDEAAKLLSPDCGEVLRTYVPLASKPVKKLPEAVCKELGDWYGTLARGASPAGRLRCLRRASQCYGRFLALHSAGDAASLKVKALLRKAGADLKALGAGAGTGRYLGTYRDQNKALWVLAAENGDHRLLPPGHHAASTSCKVGRESLLFRFAPNLKSRGYRRGAVAKFRLADIGRYEAVVGPDPDAKRPPRGVGLAAMRETTYRLVRVAEEPFAVFVSRDTAGGVFVHRFYDNGHIVLPTINCVWKLRGRRIMLRWGPDRRAPGGAWRDVGTVAADGRSYKAVNQVGCRNTAAAILGRLPVR